MADENKVGEVQGKEPTSKWVATRTEWRRGEQGASAATSDDQQFAEEEAREQVPAEDQDKSEAGILRRVLHLTVRTVLG